MCSRIMIRQEAVLFFGHEGAFIFTLLFTKGIETCTGLLSMVNGSIQQEMIETIFSVSLSELAIWEASRARHH